MEFMEKLMTLDEAAKYLRVAQSTIYGWTSSKRIPYRKAGRLLRFSKEALDEWMFDLGKPVSKGSGGAGTHKRKK